MTGRKRRRLLTKLEFSPHWLLFSLIICVLILSSLAFARPVAQNGQTLTPSQTALTAADETLTPNSTLTATAESDASPPSPEEIGYTDGIIFCSTILVLILLVGTLRETIRRKGR